MAKRKYTYQDILNIAKSHNGEVISSSYNSTGMQFKCNKNHTFNKKPSALLKGQWCPTCSGYKKCLDSMKHFALENGGLLLSKSYSNSIDIMEWKCKKGHIIRSSYNKLSARV